MDVWEYFDRIKQGMDDIKKKKDLLNPKSENYSTMLGNLDDELKAYEKIYYGILGGKNEEALKAAEENLEIQKKLDIENRKKRLRKATTVAGILSLIASIAVALLLALSTLPTILIVVGGTFVLTLIIRLIAKGIIKKSRAF